MKAREGDVIEIVDGILCDVKGLIHPPKRVVAFIRFVPDPNGDRKRNGETYRKVYALPERYALLKEAFPQYFIHDPVFDEDLCEVPVKAVKHHYRPTDRLHDLCLEHELDEVESQATRFAKLLRETAKISWSKVGISGSILVKLHTSTSDIDPIVYGTKNCYKVYSALKSLLESEESLARRYRLEELKGLFSFRSKDTIMPFKDFVRTESRKVLQGKFMGRNYFIRFIKDWGEIKERYGTVRYSNEGYAKVKAKIVDDFEVIFTPCSYKIEDVKILDGIHVKPMKEIVSFRGRFCEQARNGETVVAQGKVERVERAGEPKYYRLLLGNKASDYMILA